MLTTYTMKRTYLYGAVALVLLVGAAYFLFVQLRIFDVGDEKMVQNDPTDDPLAEETKNDGSAQSNGASEGYTEYRNESLGFALSLPPGASVDKVLDDNHNRLVTFVAGERRFEVRVKQGGSIELDSFHYLDFPQAGKSRLGGKDAVVFKAPSGYCDGPKCGEPFVAYSTKVNGDFYNLVFFGDTEVDATEDTILKSFKF